MNQKTIDASIGALESKYGKIISVADAKSRYPTRELAAGVEVLRVPPSPTGFVHIGTIYAGMINEHLAHLSGGVFILRLEDTDQKRQIEDGHMQIVKSFGVFDMDYDEGMQLDGSEKGSYGPYSQSLRADLYLAHAVELLRTGWAYPCFATAEELESNVRSQQAAKLRPGYYGKWALWRDRPDQEIIAALGESKPFILRFRSKGDHEQKAAWNDQVKGPSSMAANDLDVPLIKTDGLPTYHLAHVVDDNLMGVTKVLRGDEWLPSTPLHLELSDALGYPRLTYGHYAPISIVDKNGGGKRKMSKRKDLEADVHYWTAAGYPVPAVKEYLMRLFSSGYEDWLSTNPGKTWHDYPLTFDDLSRSRSPLLDMQKVESVCKDWIGALPVNELFDAIVKWSNSYDSSKLAAVMSSDPDLSKRILSIERPDDLSARRKDIAKWSDAYENYGYMWDEIFTADFANRIDAELADIDPSTIDSFCKDFVTSYSPADDKDAWFAKLKSAAEQNRFCLDNKELKANPDKYVGGVADAARIIRVKLTGKNRAPDLHTLMQLLGTTRLQ
jgi:glutamyl-tRNA synthetase